MIPARRLIPLIVACASFMQQIDSTIVATSLPQMAKSLGASPIQLSVSITAYVLSLAIFIPISGWMADHFGAREVFRYAILIFTLGSVLCGLSTNLPELTAARMLQGVGGAMMQPVGRLLVLRAAQKSELIGAMAWLQVPAQLGPVLGPPIGGFITTYYSWHWNFFINVPIGIIGFLLVSRFIPKTEGIDTGPLDWFGFASSAITLSCLTYGLQALSKSGSYGLSAAFLTGAAIAGAILIRHSRRHARPLLKLSLLRIPTFAANIWAGSLIRCGVDSLPFLLPLLLQLVLGMNALNSGLLTLSSAIGSMAMRALARPVLRRWGFRTVFVVNGPICAASILICVLFSPSTPVAIIFAVLLVGGFFRALQFVALNTIAYADVTQEDMSSATSFAAMSQQACNGFGVALAAICLHLELALTHASTLTLPDLRGAFVVMALFTLSAFPLDLTLSRNAGGQLISKRA